VSLLNNYLILVCVSHGFLQENDASNNSHVTKVTADEDIGFITFEGQSSSSESDGSSSDSGSGGILVVP